MANPTGSNAVAGQVGKTGIYETVSRGVKANQTIARGDCISFDANGFAQQASSGDQQDVGLGVAMIAATGTGSDGGVVVTVAIGNSWVYVKAGGAIKPLQLVKVNNSTTVIVHTKPAAATTTITNTTTSNEIDAARNYFGLTFGRYMGHQLEEKEITDAANTDVILVRLGI